MKTGEWSGLFILREIIRDSFLFGLNFTNQDFAHFDILLRSVLRISAAASGLSTIIYRQFDAIQMGTRNICLYKTQKVHWLKSEDYEIACLIGIIGAYRDMCGN